MTYRSQEWKYPKEKESKMPEEERQLLIGVYAGLNSIHTIIVREETDGRLRWMGEHRSRQVGQKRDEITLVHRVQESIQKAIEDAQVNLADILAVGLALPGQIDIENGTVLSSQFFDIKEYPFPLATKVGELLNIPNITLINNDNAQGIGEQRIGVGKRVKNFIYLRVGYNIGAGIFIDGKLYMGVDGLAGGFGHMSIDINGPKCSCGNRGCLDTLASRAAIEKKLLQGQGVGKLTILANELKKEPLDINSAIIADAIDQEDHLTCQVVEEAAEMLGTGIANIVNLLNPHTVILGGDVIDEIDLYFEKATASAQKKSLQPIMRNTSIVRGIVETTAGAYGAAVFAKQHLLNKLEQQSMQG